jgi:hypothetical protein
MCFGMKRPDFSKTTSELTLRGPDTSPDREDTRRVTARPGWIALILPVRHARLTAFTRQSRNPRSVWLDYPASPIMSP